MKADGEPQRLGLVQETLHDLRTQSQILSCGFKVDLFKLDVRVV